MKKSHWILLRKGRKVGQMVKNTKISGTKRSREPSGHPITIEESFERPFIDKDIASWEYNQRVSGKGLVLMENTEDPETIENNLHNSFHYSLGPALLIAEITGMFPVSGLQSKDSTDVRFQWLSWRTCYTLANLSVGLLICSISIYRMIVDGIDLNKAGAFVFYLTVTINLSLFLRLAVKWPTLLRDVASSELACPFPLSLRHNQEISLRRRFTIIAYAVFLGAAVEHGWSNISLLTTAFACTKNSTVVYDFFTMAFPATFYVTEYSLWKAIPMQIWNSMVTGVWNFADIFLILISLSLVHRFNLLYHYLNMTNGQPVSEQFWKTVRTEYIRLSLLVKSVDKAVNSIMSLSFSSNLYIICEQMFNSLKEKNFNEGQTECEDKKDKLFWPAVIDIVYFTISFSFLIFRFFAVSMTAAEVYNAARRPKEFLHCVPTYNYCTEVQRFLDQVSTDTIALTGNNLFTITRALILTIVGTVVTYELVLVQFYSMPSYDPRLLANLTHLLHTNTS